MICDSLMIDVSSSIYLLLLAYLETSFVVEILATTEGRRRLRYLLNTSAVSIVLLLYLTSGSSL